MVLDEDGCTADLDLFDALEAGTARIVAVRRRTGSLLDELGLSGWKRSGS